MKRLLFLQPRIVAGLVCFYQLLLKHRSRSSGSIVGCCAGRVEDVTVTSANSQVWLVYAYPNLAALDTRCTALEVGPVSSFGVYQECLRRSHACDTAAAIAAAAPRTEEMLALVQRPLSESFCPAP